MAEESSASPSICSSVQDENNNAITKTETVFFGQLEGW